MSVHAGPADWWTDGTDAGRTHIATKGIVQSGLVLNLDAGVSSSYPGSGTTWYDLSTNSKNGTLTNGPTFSNANSGTFTFDGNDDYVAVGSLGALPTAGTISYWMKSTAVENFRNPAATQYSGGNVGFRWEQYTEAYSYGGFDLIAGNDAGTFSSYDYSPGAILTANVWYNVVVTWNTSTNIITGYLNSNQSFNSSHTLWPTNIGNFSLGNGFNTSRYFKGSIPICQIYNQALTATQVKQNFNALRNRFGI